MTSLMNRRTLCCTQIRFAPMGAKRGKFCSVETGSDGGSLGPVCGRGQGRPRPLSTPFVAEKFVQSPGKPEGSLRDDLDAVEFRDGIGGWVVEESGGVAGGNDGTDGKHGRAKVCCGQDLVINVGDAVPDDQLVIVFETGDAQYRIRIKGIGARDQLLVIGHPIAVRVARADDSENARVAKINLVREDDLDDVAARRWVGPIVGEGTQTAAAGAVDQVGGAAARIRS